MKTEHGQKEEKDKEMFKRTLSSSPNNCEDKGVYFYQAPRTGSGHSEPSRHIVVPRDVLALILLWETTFPYFEATVTGPRTLAGTAGGRASLPLCTAAAGHPGHDEETAHRQKRVRE